MSDDDLKEMYDEIYSNRDISNDPNRRKSNRLYRNRMPPPLITFAELYERAQELAL